MYFPIQQSSIRGTPDFLLCCNGVFVGLELKATKGVVSKLQRYLGQKITDAQGVYLVASPTNWKKVRLELFKLDKGILRYEQGNSNADL